MKNKIVLWTCFIILIASIAIAYIFYDGIFNGLQLLPLLAFLVEFAYLNWYLDTGKDKINRFTREEILIVSGLIAVVCILVFVYMINGTIYGS